MPETRQWAGNILLVLLKMFPLFLVATLVSCENGSDFPRHIESTETFKAPSELIASLNVVSVFGSYLHLEDGFSEAMGKVLICRSPGENYRVAVYKPDETGFLLIGTPVQFGSQHPVMTVHHDRPAFSGDYEGGTRVMYVNAGELIIVDE